MHDVFRFDDQSLRKNVWISMLLAKGVRLHYGVFRESGPMPWSEKTRLRFDPLEQARWSDFTAYEGFDRELM